MKAEEARKALSTLVELYYGNRCPHETECPCRTANWCPHAKDGQTSENEPDYPMLHLAGCSMGYDRCCCRVLEEVEALASEYLRRAGVKEPPIPVDIINLCDPGRPIELRPFPLKAYFGCAWFLGNEWVVHLNSNNATDVNRFTAFHEGFHIICSNSGLSFSKVNDPCRPLGERLADYFAASILMPRPFVTEMWPRVRSVRKMAKMFGTPEPIMRDWLTRLGIQETRAATSKRTLCSEK